MVLFWYDERTEGRIYSQMVKWIRYFDMEPIVIDTLGHFKHGPSGCPHAVHSLSEAVDLWGRHQWVFMDSRGRTFLDEFDHPSVPSVYALGSDTLGFGIPSCDLPGSVVRLRKPDEIPIEMALPMVLYDRALCLGNRRR